jgi:hypothetical protein
LGSNPQADVLAGGLKNLDAQLGQSRQREVFRDRLRESCDSISVPAVSFKLVSGSDFEFHAWRIDHHPDATELGLRRIVA